MKKIMVFALAALCGTSVYAQDIKEVLGAKSYQEALQLIKSGEGAWSNENKAKAYNKVVDLALEAHTLSQASQKNDEMYAAAEAAINAALECDKYDNMPNEKNKVKPKFTKNGARLATVRASLVSEGEALFNAKDYKGAKKAFGLYLDTNNDKLFATGQPDQYGSQISYYAALSAYFAEDYKAADKYSDAALNDTAFSNDAMSIKINALQNMMKTKEDTLAVTKKFADLYAGFPNSQAAFSAYSSLLLSQGRKDDFNKLVDTALAQNPNNFAAVAMRGQSYMGDSKWDEAIADFQKALAIMPTNIPVTASLGNCYMFKAQALAERVSAQTKGRIPKNAEEQIVAVYNQAIEFLAKAKDMDTNKEYKGNWAYSLYTCLYRTLGADDPKTKAAEELTK